MSRVNYHLLRSPLGMPIARALGRSALAAPVMIGATGGSGTRAVRNLLAEAGFFMGVNEQINHAGDAMQFEPSLDEFINPVLDAAGRLDYALTELPPPLRWRVLWALRRSLRAYLRERPRTKLNWGWKNPRSMYLLPFFKQIFPGLRFVHLVRDGRDMAVSDNQAQYRKHFSAAFGRPPVGQALDPMASCQLWSKVNLEVARYGAGQLDGRYLRLRLEDLVTDPTTEITRLLVFAGLDPGAAASLKAHVRTPDTMYRWRQALDEISQADMISENRTALAEFGYLAQAQGK